MRVLSIEVSTSSCSIATLDGYKVMAEETWIQDRSRGQRLFSSMSKLLSCSGCRLEALDGFVVGIGPGAFSSLRMALSAAYAMALPDKKPVFGLSSAEVLAWTLAKEQGAASVTVIGNARREQLWIAHYDTSGQTPIAQGGFELLSSQDLTARLPDHSLIASPDWDSLADTLQRSVSKGTNLITGKVFPTARATGILALEKCKHSAETLAKMAHSQAPLSPIYLHPATVATPRPLSE